MPYFYFEFYHVYPYASIITILDTLNKVCLMIKLRVEDIIEMTATDEEREKYYQ